MLKGVGSPEFSTLTSFSLLSLTSERSTTHIQSKYIRFDEIYMLATREEIVFFSEMFFTDVAKVLLQGLRRSQILSTGKL